MFKKFFAWLFKKKQPQEIKLKLGLALGSGGAKGFAELGAIKAFEENGIQFDMVAGASIGSIVGAFIADGFTSSEIYEMLNNLDASEIKTRLMINMDTFGLFNVIDRSIGSKNIEELKKPLFVVATNADEDSEKVFTSGSTAKALCASASYPPFFKPVVIDGVNYIDGAFTNSVPADLLKNAGADFVVGIDLSDHQQKGGLLSFIMPTYKGKVKEPWQKGYLNSDVMLHPDLTGYKAVSFGAGSQMYEIGYQCALDNMENILSGIEKLKQERQSQNLKKQKKQKKEKVKKNKGEDK